MGNYSGTEQQRGIGGSREESDFHWRGKVTRVATGRLQNTRSQFKDRSTQPAKHGNLLLLFESQSGTEVLYCICTLLWIRVRQVLINWRMAEEKKYGLELTSVFLFYDRI